MIAILALVLTSSPTLGLTAGSCNAGRPGADIIVSVAGLKDRAGRLRLELYPDNDADFLADDNVLLQHGKTFARVDLPAPASGPVELCIRAPGPGSYALALLHDRNGNHRFDVGSDGVGFAGNPKLGWSRPHAANARVVVAGARTAVTIAVNYWRGLSMRPGK